MHSRWQLNKCASEFWDVAAAFDSISKDAQGNGFNLPGSLFF